jgi:signal transduction histidine kinase
MYGEIKDMTEFLEIVNACISHELRNPLNSIAALNFLKKIMYTKLREVLNSL